MQQNNPSTAPERELVAELVRATAAPSADRRARVRQFALAADGRRALELFVHLGVSTRLGRLLLDDPELELPAMVTEALRSERTIARHRGLLHHGLTVRLCHELEAKGIPTVPLKGAMLADTVYGDLGARQSSDIDLLVPVAQLDAAVELAEQQGWRDVSPRPGELPRLHRELVHDTLPALELHWRVHWYERSYAEQALARAHLTPEGWRRLQPADELAFLLLFLARDGFAGLRQLTDVAAWWAALGQPGETAAAIGAIAEAHPQLAPALGAAARHVEDLGAIPRGSLAGNGALSTRQRAALRLANPWLRGSRQQIAADISFVDGLLTPRGGGRAFLQRQLLAPEKVESGRLGHATRVLGRYVLASRAFMSRDSG